MRRVKPWVATGAVSLLAVALLGVGMPQRAAAAADEGVPIEFSGGYVQVQCPITKVRLDPDTGYLEMEWDGPSALLYGDFIGYDHTRGTFTYDPATGQGRATFHDTFTGVYAADGSYGTMELEGTLEGGELISVPGLGTFPVPVGEVRIARRIVGGTGDFERSRGYWDAVGSHVTCQGGGDYEGRWIRP